MTFGGHRPEAIRITRATDANAPIQLSRNVLETMDCHRGGVLAHAGTWTDRYIERAVSYILASSSTGEGLGSKGLKREHPTRTDLVV